MPRFIVETRAKAIIKERWLVEAATEERAREILLNDGDSTGKDPNDAGEDLEHLEDITLDEEDREIISVELAT